MTEPSCWSRAIAQFGDYLISIANDLANASGIENPPVIEWQGLFLHFDGWIDDLETA